MIVLILKQLQNTLATLSGLLTRILSNSLDHTTFLVVDKQVDESQLPKQCVRLYGHPDPDVHPSENALVVPSARSFAVVDRYADMLQAASSILRSRFAFGGQAPIAPDVVLVNEFRVKEFCQAIAEKSSSYFAQQVEMNGGFDHAAAAKARAARTLSLDLDKAGADVLISGSNGTVVRVNDRKSSLLLKKINEPLLVIHPVSSLDDAIDYVNSTSAEPLTSLSAFGNPEVGKYLSQFIAAHVCCINDIPVELLVAPLTPLGFATQLEGPYRREMFSKPYPRYVQFGAQNEKLTRILDTNDTKEAAKLGKQARTTNTDVKRPAGHAVGFFEQGLLFGASIGSTAIVLSSVMMWKYGIPALKSKIWR